jgi:hypothetical protein
MNKICENKQTKQQKDSKIQRNEYLKSRY